jgi:serine/threonine-protein kinase
MAQVFEARDLRLGRRVALKVDTEAGAAGASRLRLEGQALAALHSPFVVTVHDVGSHRGRDYLVLDLIYGETLEQRMAERERMGHGFAIDEALQILTGITRALADVHQAGLAHRDLKPANIMLEPRGQAVLIDFGIVMPEVLVGSEALVAGTPFYMAPEALTNRLTRGSGRRLDLYALGVIAFELLAGRRPYDAATLIELVERQKRPPPNLTCLRIDAPPPLVTLLSECLAFNPDDRPTEIEAVREELRAIVVAHGRGTDPGRQRERQRMATPQPASAAAKTEQGRVRQSLR